MKKNIRLTEYATYIITALLMLFLIVSVTLDLIYGTSLFTNKQYYSSFDFLNITPPQSRRANILSLGSYSGFNFTTFKSVLTQMILALDYEIAIAVILLALNYYFAYIISKSNSIIKKNASILKLFIWWYLLVLFGDFIIITLNLIPFHDLAYYASIFGLLTIVASLVKLALILFTGIYFILLIIEKMRALDQKD